jgi:hypothetical protein
LHRPFGPWRTLHFLPSAQHPLKAGPFSLFPFNSNESPAESLIDHLLRSSPYQSFFHDSSLLYFSRSICNRTKNHLLHSYAFPLFCVKSRKAEPCLFAPSLYL